MNPRAAIPRLLIPALLLCGRVLGQPPEVSLSVAEDGTVTVSAAFSVAAPVEAVWDVLADYDRIADFVSSVSESRVVERMADGRIFVRQKATAGVWFFRKRISVELRIEEDPLSRITFEDVSRANFHHYRGHWMMQPDSADVTEVSYRLEARRRFFAPGFLADKALAGTIAQYLEEVVTEIRRREETVTPATAGDRRARDAWRGSSENATP